MRCQLPWHGSMTPWPKEKRSDAGDKGNAVHEVAEAHTDGTGVAPADYQAARTINDVVRVAVDELTQDSIYVAERALAYNPVTRTARLLEKTKGHRDYSQVRDGELVGTADLIVVRPGSVVVLDHKTGRNARKSPARESWQLRLLAVALAALLGADAVTVTLIHIEDGDYYTSSHTFFPWDLDEYADKLEAMTRAIQSSRLTANPGPWCYSAYCPVRTKCPETKAALARAEEKALVRLPVLQPLQTDDEARAWNTGIKLLEEFVRQAKDELHAYARGHVVELGDGMWLGQVEEEGNEKFDLSKPGALKAIVKVAGTQAVEYKTTKKAIEAATRGKQTKRGEGKRHADALYEELRRRGALSSGKPYLVVKEFKRAGELSEANDLETVDEKETGT